MKTTELQLGNYVSVNSKKIKVAKILENMIVSDKNIPYDISEIEPIPITPSILRRLGFEQLSFSDKNDVYYITYNTDFRAFYTVSITMTNIDCIYRGISFNYLHELQNLLTLCKAPIDAILD